MVKWPKRKRRAQRHRCRMQMLERATRVEARARERRDRQSRHAAKELDKRRELCVRIFAPPWLCLSPRTQGRRKNSRHTETARFVDDLRRAFEACPSQICIDFTKLTQVVSDGMLLFFSELCSLTEAYPDQRLRCAPSKDDTVNQVLEHLGVYRMLGHRSGVRPSREDVVSWKVESSEIIDAKKPGEMIDSYDYLVGTRSKNMFRATTEAITNAVNHAYDYSRRTTDGHEQLRPRRWWMFCREDNDTLIIAVCDRGMGIPVSLPAKFAKEHWWKLVSKFSRDGRHRDASFIRAAAVMRRTRTNEPNRGKGLPDVIQVADRGSSARVFIHSNRGILARADGRFHQHEMKQSIRGTLIIWQLPIPEDSDHEQHEDH